MEILYTEVFERWLKGLRDLRARVAIASRIERIEDGNFGDHRSVGNGVSELRVNVGQGYGETSSAPGKWQLKSEAA